VRPNADRKGFAVAPYGIVSLPTEIGVFCLDKCDDLATFFHVHGFAVLRGLWGPTELAELDAACADARDRLISGDLPNRYGTVDLIDDTDRSVSTVNYVTHLTEIAPAVRCAVRHPELAGLAKRLLGDCWLLEGMANDPFGVVFQDARPGTESRYTRIGWHSDWQSGPHLDRWPAMAFTVHLDATSPANGFLRVVPGSHRWATPAPFRNVNNVPVPDGAKPAGGHTDSPPPYEMPLGFDKVPGEIGVYCERGDVLFHDAYLWHAAARATADDAVRRHIRGSWYTGAPDPDASIADFVKNAAR
jgi:hypothetical protein